MDNNPLRNFTADKIYTDVERQGKAIVDALNDSGCGFVIYTSDVIYDENIAHLICNKFRTVKIIPEDAQTTELGIFWTEAGEQALCKHVIDNKKKYVGKYAIFGETGAAGPMGMRGKTGERGKEGASGLEGLRGEPGQTGQPGERGETGETGHDGSRGEAGVAGSQGRRGETGATGQNGQQGEAGEKWSLLYLHG